MKLYLNDNQRNIVMEMLRASEDNAVKGKDAELAEAFNELYRRVSPTNAVYVSLNREEAETLVEFCDVVRKSLANAVTFIKTKSEKSEEEKKAELEQAESFLSEISEVMDQLQGKIRANPAGSNV
jgi:urate oxidase